MVKFISLFSGVGGFDLGLEAAGWQCVAQVEWDKNCQAVLARHWPDVPRWGDVSTVSGADLPAADVVAFGSPCQDLSVAGKRAGLDGHRSGLFFEAIRIIKEMQDATAGTFPRFVIWENVAGALSSSGGWDFAAVLDSLGELGALDIAWRVLDARFFGVPQRRRRVFVVADLAGQCAGAIHAEQPGVRWHPPTRNQEGPQPAAGIADSVGVDSDRHCVNVALTETVGTLTPGAHPGGFNGQDAYTGHLVVVNAQWAGSASEADVAAPLLASRGGHKTTDIDGGTFVVQPQVFEPKSLMDENWAQVEVKAPLRAEASQVSNVVVFTKAKRASSVDDDETWVDGQTAPTLNSFDNTGDSRATVVAVAQNQRGEVVTSDYAHALTNGGGKPGQGYPAVLTSSWQGGSQQDQFVALDDVSPCLAHSSNSHGGNHQPKVVVPLNAAKSVIRRLTPLECERLMGWPDDHTRWRADRTEQADSVRYRQCGNGVASPVATWIADQLNRAMSAAHIANSGSDHMRIGQ